MHKLHLPYALLLPFVLTLFVFFVAASAVSADVQVPATISADTTWSKDQGVYVANQDVTVNSGVTLTIEEGTIVKFQTNRRLLVDGTLVLSGTDTESTYITSIHDDSIGGDTNVNGTTTTPEGSTRRWGGVTFRTGSVGTISYGILQYAGFPNSQRGQEPVVYNQGGTVQVEHTTLFNNGSYGLGQTVGTLEVRDSVIDTHAIGAAIKQGDITFERTTFKESSNFGLMVGGAGILELSEVVFLDSYQAAGFWLDQGRVFNQVNATASGGEYDGILLRGSVTSETTLPQSDTISYYISGVGGSPIGIAALRFNDVSGLKVETTGVLKFAPGAVIKADAEAGIDVAGVLEAIGTKENPVLFTAPQDSFAGAVRSGSVAPGKGGYVQILPTGQATFTNTKHHYSSGMFSGLNAAIINNGGTLSVTHSELINNEFAAVYHTSGQTTIEQSSLGDKGNAGVFNSSAVPLTVSNNYWADASGPYHSTVNASGTGSIISDNVLVAPWLTEFNFNPPPPPEPTGASSILFLPGIMGSRLYEESDACDDDGVVVQERWFSTNECEQLRLKTDFTGQPLHSLYTTTATSSIIDNVFFVSPLYGEFLDRLAEEKENEVIADYRAVPYDWRLKLGDILKTKNVAGKIVFDSQSTYQQSYLYTSLQELVSTSDSGKVTIVAHSNGGLLAKALLLEMQVNNDPLLDKIDNLILVAVPQTGTPDAVVGLLQGTEITGGIVIDEVVSRDILNTAPFGHHLLPSAGYFSGSGTSVETPVLQFLPGGVSGIWRNEYGEGIVSVDNLHRFLSKDSNRYNPDKADLSQPEVIDNFLLDYSKVIHAGQASFIPPSTMKVSQVAGIGISTPATLTYFTHKECVNRSIFSFFQCTEYRDKLGYSVRMAPEGDGTVVVPSALAMSENNEVKRFWMDLLNYNNNNAFSSRVHRNILEVPDIQNFILNTAEGTTTRSYTYLNDEEIQLETAARLVFQLHSPLDMWVNTNNGEVSSSTNQVPGAIYRRVGEVQYIEVPGTEERIELYMVGKATGSFTLEVEQWQGNVLEERVDYLAVPTATNTLVTADFTGDITQTFLELDLEGDGQIEGEMNQDEVFTATVISYEDLILAVNSLNLSRSKKQALLTLIKSAEYYGTKVPMKKSHLLLEDLLLRTSDELVRLYVKKRYITASDSVVILEMIKVLKNKQ